MKARLENYLVYWNEHEDKKPWYWNQIPIDKYLKSGIYCIRVNGVLLYIGQSVNIHDRICAHMRNIETNQKENKYLILRRLFEMGYTISFDLLLDLEDETRLLLEEKKLIERHRPLLNSIHNFGFGREVSIGTIIKEIEEKKS